jgi:uncharacterized SAM-binding protein YcdF (DUF218 family)
MVLKRIGRFLIKHDPLVSADAIVVLTGNIPDRVLEAYDVYDKGFSNRIIIVEDNHFGYDEIRKKGILFKSQSEILCSTLVDMGVSSEHIHIIAGKAQSTKDESFILKEYLGRVKSITSIILITSNYHSKRSILIFRKKLKKLQYKVKIISCPSKYTGFDGSYWWKTRSGKKTVLIEYLKLMNFCLSGLKEEV